MEDPMKVVSLAGHAQEARFWTPEQMAEKFLEDLRSGNLGEIDRACIVYTNKSQVAYYNAGTHSKLELIGMLSMLETALAVLPDEEMGHE